ncbi:MAG: hypothetical protein ACMG6H_01650, partial [Acidobacteriota bacterium]
MTDFAVALDGANGPRLLVFEGPEGAITARPEIFALTEIANQLALGQLDADYPIDLAVAAGHDLLILHGRDRRLSLDRELQAQVLPAYLEHRYFPTVIVSITIGDFVGNQQSSLAVLTNDGTVQVLSRDKEAVNESAIEKASTGYGQRLMISQELLSQANAASKSKPGESSNQVSTSAGDWHSYQISSGQWPQATQLISVHTSGLPGDDLLVMDPGNRQLQILTESRRQNTEQVFDSGPTQFNPVSLNLDSAPLAVLPMLLNGDALQDLVILREGQSATAVAFTGVNQDALSLTYQSAPGSQVQKPTREPSSVVPTIAPADVMPSQRSAQPLSEKTRVKSESNLVIPDSFGSCASSPISAGQTINASLTTSDCPFGDGSYFDDYSFSGTSGQQIAVSMSSSSFDTYLILLAPDGSLLKSDDDGGGGTNSYIPSEGGFYILPSSGTFTIRTNSIFSNATGNYSVTLMTQSSGACPSTAVSLGQTINGALSTSDCHITSGDRTNSYVDLYRFTGVSGQQISITMSATFDTYLYLVNPDNTVLSQDDDGGGGTNSRIPPVSGVITLSQSGSYLIYATSFNAFDTGSYTLSLGVISGSTVVTNTNDSGTGSLRQAILNANATAALDTISFNISGSGVRTISPLSELPTITAPVFIDGATQPGYAGTPLIELNGTSAGANAPGLKITAGSSRVRGLVINRFNGSGIVLTTNGGNIIDGNYFGTNAAGTGSLGNAQFAVQIDGSNNNTVGGTTVAARNLISGNGFSGSGYSGIRLSGIATGNTISGNHIGTDVTGTVDLGNSLNGIYVASGYNNTLGGTAAGARNLISGNNLPGIALANTGPSGDLVQANFIGTNAAGTVALPNEYAGLIIGGFAVGGDCNGCPMTATNNTIGGTTAAARNIISGNHGHGLEVINNGSQLNNIQGNYIGTNAAGNAKIGNTSSGIFITRAPNNTIGGTVAGAGNVISGNQQHGIGVGIPRFDSVSGQTITGGTGVKIQFNFIGTAADGVSNLGNLQSGIYLDADTVVNTIEGNVIAFNGTNGITIPANSNPGVQITISSNKIFSNASTAIDLGNPGDTPNDDLDADIGANTQQNYPEFTSVISNALSLMAGEPQSATTVTIAYRMRSSRNSTFKVDFFASNGPCQNKQFTDSRGAFIGTENVTTDANGNVNRTITLPLPAAVNNPLSVLATATATNVPANTVGASPGNTSEMSQCLQVGAGNPTGTVRLTAPDFPIAENNSNGFVTVSAIREGDTAGAASVNFATSDTSSLNAACSQVTGKASERCDYATSLGTLN